MTDAEFKMTWDLILAVARTAQFIQIEEVQDLLKTVGFAHAFGPMVDPTAYRDGGMDNLDDQQELAEGFLAFRKAIEKVKARVKV